MWTTSELDFCDVLGLERIFQVYDTLAHSTRNSNQNSIPPSSSFFDSILHSDEKTRSAAAVNSIILSKKKIHNSEIGFIHRYLSLYISPRWLKFAASHKSCNFALLGLSVCVITSQRSQCHGGFSIITRLLTFSISCSYSLPCLWRYSDLSKTLCLWPCSQSFFSLLHFQSLLSLPLILVSLRSTSLPPSLSTLVIVLQTRAE
ncbi:hypothetical protein Bca52824_019904 [Brassica carinata]|uniref:Uncharacterized protein n=1 Tax=Brassica carinata TaxID=52824 RepID=A0A8X8B0V0_BRACI|nr:hypothetical protein Bca52824_019904 [Brassica carinata]